ncbi:MAG: spermidine/putrescine ABC transporter substrate-binding protein [Treponema sp.]|jgi:spermidine/putrescine-binding protein|nr:spermidine/putrescine ABC transporter substrate-binding protein [Treponema sp.]
MKKLCALIAILSVIAGGCKKNSAAEKGGETLTLFTWAEMFPPELLEGFTQDTGIPVNYVNFLENEDMLSRLETSGGYDLVVADDYIIETVIEKGLAAKLNKGLLKNYGNINPLYQEQFYDRRDEYTVPYGAGVQTIVYDPERVSINIQGYADLLDPSLRNRIGIIENYRVINGLALKMLGKSYNTENIADIRAAGEKLLELAPNIRLIKDDRLEEELLSGEIDAAVMYTSQANMASMVKPELKQVFPQEGIGFGIMAFFIPAATRNSGAAHAFIDYVLDPARGAACFEFINYYSTYSASDPLIKEEYREFLSLPSNFNSSLELIQNISAEALEEQDRIWTAFQKAAGQ